MIPVLLWAVPVGMLSALFRSWVLTLLWRWFAVTQFGVAPLSVWIAFGLLTLWGLVENPPPNWKDEVLTHDVALQAIVRQMAGSVYGLGLAAIAAHFVAP